MNKIDFISIRGKNFRCYKEFELKFDSNKLIAIIGKNGKGKSTYLMAITALLYGETPKGEKIPSLVNNKVGKNLELIGDFRINTDNYTIERYYKHYQMKDALIIKKNGVDISKESTPETYKFISSLLVSKDVFMNSVYFSQQVKDFFTALTDSKQKDIFNAILDLKDYEIDYNKAKDSADNISEKIESLKEQRMMKKNEFDAAQLRLHYEMNDIKNKLQERKNKVESLNKTKETNIQEIEDINKQKSFIEYDESKHQELIKYISISQVVIGNIENEFKTFSNLKQTELETYINNLNQSHQLRILEEKNNVEEEFSKYKKQQEPKISELSQKKIDLVNQIHSKREKEDLVFYEGIRNIDNQIFEYQSKIKELQEESKCKDLNSEMEKEISNINNRISELEKTKNDFQKEVLKLKDDKEKSVELVKVLSNNLSKQFPICSLCKQEIKSKEARNNVEDEIKRLNLVIKECDIHIEEIKNKFQPIKDEYKKLNDDIDQIKIKYDNLINSKISNALEEIKKISTKNYNLKDKRK